MESLKTSKDLTARGPAFDQYVRRLFAREHFKVTMNPGGAKPRQVDLMASRHDLTCLVETKWQKRPADIDDVDSLFTRLAEVQASVIGVFVSWSGFTKTVVSRVEDKRARPVLLVTGEELERTNSLVRLLRHKHEYLVTRGEVVFGTESLEQPSGKSDLPVGSDRFV